MKKSWRHYIDSLLLGGLGLLGILISIFDYLDWFGRIPWVDNDRIPTLVLLLLGGVALFLVIERRIFFEEKFDGVIEQLTKLVEGQEAIPTDVIRALEGVKVRVFYSSFDLLEHATQRVREAKGRIDDTSWGIALGYESQLQKNQKISIAHHKQMETFAKNNTYREIFIFNQPYQLEKMKSRVAQGLLGYSCAYYENPPDALLLNFMIVDDQEVILLADNFEGNMAIQHPEIVKMFKAYYQMLWDQAEIIKDPHGVRQDVYDRIIAEFDDTKTQ